MELNNLVPPNCIRAEAQILSACMLSEKDFLAVREAIKPAMFYKKVHQQIFECMVKHETTDMFSLADKLSAIEFIDVTLGEIMAEYAAGSLRDQIELVKDKYVRRSIIEASMSTIEDAFSNTEIDGNAISNTAHSRLYDAVVGSNATDPTSMLELVPKVYESFGNMPNAGVSGITTGLIDVDFQICGFQPGEFIVIAGRPSMGKSALADQIVRHNSMRNGKTVAVFSVEMSKQLWAARAICSEAGVSYHAVRSKTLPKRDYSKIAMACVPVADSKVYIDDTGSISPAQIITKSNFIKAKGGLDLILVDYMQLMELEQRKESRQQEITSISKRMKGIAKMFNVPVIALAQLSRKVEDRKPPIPMLSDLRESGAIEQDADVVLFLYRPEYYNPKTSEKGICHIQIAKQRNGPVGDILTRFEPNTMRFFDLKKEEMPNSWGND